TPRPPRFHRERCHRWDRGNVTAHSGCTPEAFTIGGHFFISAARKVAYCGIDQNCGSKPSLLRPAASSGDFIASLISALSFSRIAGGVPAGARKPAQKVRDNCGRPL